MRWERGKEIVLAANPDYFDGPPKLSRLVYRIFAGRAARAGVRRVPERRASRTLRFPRKDYRQIIANRAYQYVRRPMFNLRHYGINTRIKPLDDRRVRQALVYAIDREAIVSEVWLGRYALAKGILPPGTLGFNPKLKGYPYDPAKARELLAQAGYPGGKGLPAVTIWSSVRSDEILREHERIRKDLDAVGITAEFQYNADWPSFSKAMAERKLPIFLRAWFADVPDPDNFLTKLFHSGQPVELRWVCEPRRGCPPRPRAGRAGHGPACRDLPPGRGARHGRRRRDPRLASDVRAAVPAYVKGVEVSGLGDAYIPFRKVWLERPPR